jgi:hypothetical protein
MTKVRELTDRFQIWLLIGVPLAVLAFGTIYSVITHN